MGLLKVNLNPQSFNISLVKANQSIEMYVLVDGCVSGYVLRLNHCQKLILKNFTLFCFISLIHSNSYI